MHHSRSRFTSLAVVLAISSVAIPNQICLASSSFSFFYRYSMYDWDQQELRRYSEGEPTTVLLSVDESVDGTTARLNWSFFQEPGVDLSVEVTSGPTRLETSALGVSDAALGGYVTPMGNTGIKIGGFIPISGYVAEGDSAQIVVHFSFTAVGYFGYSDSAFFNETIAGGGDFVRQVPLPVYDAWLFPPPISPGSNSGYWYVNSHISKEVTFRNQGSELLSASASPEDYTPTSSTSYVQIGSVGSNFSVFTVPEPNSLLLAVLASLGLGVFARRRSSRTRPTTHA